MAYLHRYGSPFWHISLGMGPVLINCNILVLFFGVLSIPWKPPVRKFVPWEWVSA